MTAPNNNHSDDPYEFETPDAGFDLRQGVKLLFIIVLVVVIVTLICTYLARR